MPAWPRRRPRAAPLSALAVASALACLALPAVATAATWQVTNPSDGASTCPSATACTLRGAITMANGGSGDTVQVPAGHYTLGAVVPVTKAMQIVGAGAVSTEVQQLAVAGILSVGASTTHLTISGLTLTGAATDAGGAISSAAGELTLSDDVIARNRSSFIGAGGYGAVQIDSSTPTTLTVTRTEFSSNSAGSDGTATVSSGQGLGGAINFDSPGTLTVSDSRFDANTAGGNGGGGTSSAAGGGGAIEVENSVGSVAVTISGSTFTANHAGGNGGGGPASAQASGGAVVFEPYEASSLVITDSTFANNTAGGNGGAGGYTGTGNGGAVFAYGPDDGMTVSISGSTFVGNRAGGTPGGGEGGGQGAGGAVQAEGPGTVMFLNTTMSSNAALGGGLGGGLYTATATTIVNSTLTGGSAGGGGNVSLSAATLTLTNTIVAGGLAAQGANCLGAINSGGHNVEDADTCSLGAPGDRIGVSPALGPLAGNGGPTQTMAPLAGSPAIDGGGAGGCPAKDQRGALRPAGAACDAGAVENATPGAATGAASAIAATSATLNGTAFNPDVATAGVSFEYGTTTAYGTQTPPQDVGAASAAAPVTAAVSGLAPGTAYHYRVLVTNAVGAAAGEDQTFTTATVPPVLGNLRLGPARFRAQRGSGASIARAKKAARGTTISFGASQSAVTTFAVQRPHKGFRSKGRCRSRRPKGVKKPRRCTRYTGAGSFQYAGLAGANRFHFTGRVKGKPLRAGRYRLRARARNDAGQIGAALTKPFRILR
jgi:hypothetical protein